MIKMFIDSTAKSLDDYDNNQHYSLPIFLYFKFLLSLANKSLLTDSPI